MRSTVWLMCFTIFMGCRLDAWAYGMNSDIDVDRRLSYLEDQVGRINGKLDEITYSLQLLQQTQAAPVHIPAASGSQLEPFIMPVNTPAKTPASEVNVLPNGNAQEDYNRAMTYLRNKNYGKAEAILSTFVKKYPHDALNVNAKYWLGETYLNQSQFDKAAIMFKEVYLSFRQQNQNGTSEFKSKQSRAKAPEALLKLAFALKGMKNNEGACATLGQLKKEFPTLPQNLIKLAEKAHVDLKCQ